MRRLIALIALALSGLAAPALAQVQTPVPAAASATGPQRGAHIEAELTTMTAWAAPKSAALNTATTPG